MAPEAPHGKRRCWISSLDLIDGRGPGFPRPAEAKKFGPFFPPQNILYVCVYEGDSVCQCPPCSISESIPLLP